jgi:hypothetical protein
MARFEEFKSPQLVYRNLGIEKKFFTFLFEIFLERVLKGVPEMSFFVLKKISENSEEN